MAVVAVIVPPAMLMRRGSFYGGKCAEKDHDGDYGADQNSHNLSSPFLFLVLCLAFEDANSQLLPSLEH